MEKYKNLEIVEQPLGKAGKILTGNFKYSADKIDELESDISGLQTNIDNLDVSPLESRMDVVEGDLIIDPITLYCSPVGNDTTGDGSESSPWYSINKAMDFLSNKRINNETTIVIKNGHYSYSEPLEIRHHDGEYINIIAETDGQTELTGSVNHISSVETGITDVYDMQYDITVGDTHGAVVDDWISICHPREGVNTERIGGFHKIVNVSGNTLRILVRNYGSDITSGAIVSNVVIHRSVINEDYEGDEYLVTVYSKINKISGLGIVGMFYFSGGECGDLGYMGLYNVRFYDKSSVNNFHNSGCGEFRIGNSFVFCDKVASNSSFTNHCIQTYDASISFEDVTISGRYGLQSWRSICRFNRANFRAYGPGIQTRETSELLLWSSNIYGFGGTGISSSETSRVTLHTCLVEGYSTSISCLRHGFIALRETTIKDTNIGISITELGKVSLITGVVFDNVGTLISPVGVHNSYGSLGQIVVGPYSEV